MLRWLVPDRYVRAVEDLDPERLYSEGVDGVILDLDNTLVAWDAQIPTPEVQQWVAAVTGRGLRACIVSNDFTGRARRIAAILGLPVVSSALKPTPWAIRRAMAAMNTDAAQTVLVGDQLFTDVLGGNLLGLRTILVEPLSVQEFPTTRLVRRIERVFRRRLRRELASDRRV